MPFSRLQEAKLADCQRHGLDSGAELFVVEGDSASKSVCRARNPQTQAVLPMQGKPMNAIKASKNAVGRYALFQALAGAIGTGWDDGFELTKLRYDRVILLFDPDADGIHCGALMLMFFHRWMRPLLESGRLSVIRPPLYEISLPQTTDKLHAYSDAEYRRLCAKLAERGVDYQGQRYRGLASMSDVTLVETCIDPKTRNINRLTCKDAASAIRIFMGESPRS